MGSSGGMESPAPGRLITSPRLEIATPTARNVLCLQTSRLPCAGTFSAGLDIRRAYMLRISVVDGKINYRITVYAYITCDCPNASLRARHDPRCSWGAYLQSEAFSSEFYECQSLRIHCCCRVVARVGN